MENLIIKGSANAFFIPSVNFNAETGILEISGESYLEDTRSFYIPLVSWIEQYIKEAKRPISLNFRLSYYNTSSSRCIMELFYPLKEYQEEGGEVSIYWYYNEDDIEVQEEIEDFEIESGLKINLVLEDETE